MKYNRTENKEPSLFKQLITIHYEQAKRRKALRILAKQEWSVEFLTTLVMKAATNTKPIELEIVNKSGNKFIIRSLDKTLRDANTLIDSDDIFNHLDDEAAVNRFIREHSRG